MTDNDIIKAKEYFTYGITHDIFSAPVISHAKTALLAFGEINRQKAEIEELKEDNKQFANHLVAIGDFIEKVRAEAIKEFAERVKQDMMETYDDCRYTTYHVDALVKEMVGERE